MRITHSPEQTEALGQRIANACQGGEVIRLCGDLGMGKTRFAKGIAAGLGIDPNSVTSPTFTLMQIHHGRLPLYHIDLYRIDDPREIAHLDLFAELDGPGITLVEWPKLGGHHVPDWGLTITVCQGDTDTDRIWTCEGDEPLTTAFMATD